MRTKLFLLMSVLILTSIISYLFLAIKLFKEDKTSLVYELNASHVKTISAEIEAHLSKFSDKVRLLTQGYQEEDWVQAVFSSEPSLISYSLYAPSTRENRWNMVTFKPKEDYLELYGLDREAIGKLRKDFPLPFEEILEEKSLILNSTHPKGAPILTLARALEVEGSDRPYVAVVDLRSDKLLSLMRETGVASVYLVDRDGKVIVHPEVEMVHNRTELLDIPIVREAIESAVPFKLKEFNWRDTGWLGAYSKVNIGGGAVISQVRESEVLRAASQLIDRSIWLTLIIITISLFFTSLLAQHFSKPLHRLVLATRKISNWEDDSDSTMPDANRKDEVGSLVRAFESMSTNLDEKRKEIEEYQRGLEEKVKERTADLEAQKKKAAEAQDALLRTTRLASLGEIAGIAAHEVLNPANNMNIRLEKMKNILAEHEKNDFSILGSITKGWLSSYYKGGWDKLREDLSEKVPSEDQDGNPVQKELIQEDLENLQGIAVDHGERIIEREKDYKFLSDQINRVTKILNNMRSLARVKHSRQVLNLHDAVDDTLAALSDLFEKKGVKLETSFERDDENPLQLMADKDELVQVFSNVLRNSIQAIEASGKQEGRIEIRTMRRNDRIEMEISDNGVGIPEEDLQRVFRHDFTTKPADKGTGLGLSISRRLVRAFDGDIEVAETKPGEGTRFLIWFPNCPT